MICNNLVSKILYCFHLFYFAIRWIIRNFQAGTSDSLTCLVGKTAIVTGGNRGIGYATAVLLASRGCKVIIASRSDASAAKEEIEKKTRNKNILTTTLNLCSLRSVRDCAECIKKTEKKIDILINNAGVGALRQKVTEDGLNATMQTNFFGAFLLTHLLLELLKASGKARVIFTTSGMAALHRLTIDNLNTTDYKCNSWSSAYLYTNSKLCNILAGHEFARRLSGHEINFNTADTGAARTDIYKKAAEESNACMVKFFAMISHPFLRDKFSAAQTTFHLASSEKLEEETGKLYFRCKPIINPAILDDREFCENIWKKSMELVGLNRDEEI